MQNGSRYWVSGYPELVAQWDRVRNGEISPEAVSAGSARMIWWRCPRGADHLWKAKPNNRTSGTGCPFCANKRVSTTNNLKACFPDAARQWHPTKNGEVEPSEVVATSSRVCWWRCARGHEWRASVRDRSRDQTGCPYCAGRRATRGGSLADRHPEVSREWHPTRNADLTPRDVRPGSSRVVWWQCDANPAHCWRASIVNRVRRASGCPRCARQQQARV